MGDQHHLAETVRAMSMEPMVDPYKEAARRKAIRDAETREGRNGGTFIPWLDKWVCRWCFDLNNLAALKACPGAHHDGRDPGLAPGPGSQFDGQVSDDLTHKGAPTAAGPQDSESQQSDGSSDG